MEGFVWVSNCSTPIGITGKNTIGYGSYHARIHPCSTPIGITGKNTISLSIKTLSSKISAQRLSASQVRTQR